MEKALEPLPVAPHATMVDWMMHAGTPMNVPSASSDFMLLDAGVVAHLLA